MVLALAFRLPVVVALAASALLMGAADSAYADGGGSGGSVGTTRSTGVSGSTGYDISYPQCGGDYPSGSFGIVGVDAGYPFVYYNPCLADQYAKTPNAALYINTGYDPKYATVDGTHTTADCAALSVYLSGTSDQQKAWAVGCSEASLSMAYAASQGASNPSAWWLDVETANSWSSTELTLNQYTLQGIVDTMQANASVPVGVYAAPDQWNTIVGNLRVTGLSGDWVATGRSAADGVSDTCATTGFSGDSVVLVQYIGDFDYDYAC